MEIGAKWIWRKQRNYNAYNQTVIARKRFRQGEVRDAQIAITADSYYRLYINGTWVNDGPCRSWPWHYQYDVIDAAPYLQKGENCIEIIARYFGVGTFHQVPEQAGLLVQLEVMLKGGKKTTIVSDGTWEVAEARAWRPNTPKVSIQMEPAEYYDARLEKGLRFSKAAELFDAHGGPWKDLHPRDCALLTRQPFAPRRFIEANVVASDWRRYTFPMARLAHPGLIEANRHVNTAGAVATCLVAGSGRTVTVDGFGMDIAVNGKRGNRGRFRLRSGDNFLLAATKNVFNHQYKETGVRFVDCTDVTLQNPVDPSHENPWVYVPFREVDYVGNDIAFFSHRIDEREEVRRAIERNLAKLKRTAIDIPTFLANYGNTAQCLPSQAMLLEDPHPRFEMRRVIREAGQCVTEPRALMHENAEATVVKPSKRGDIELVYDLGEQNVGYYSFEFSAAEGTILDIFGIEYINSQGDVQHTGIRSGNNRNGMRYICREGLNQFISLKRRSGRYLFLTLRDMTGPVSIRKVELLESTYPVSQEGAFECSDAALTRIWDISARTLKLCMEDTFTDCPLYEQTLWVGDARNEALFAFTAFGAYDLARRCIALAGQSVERFPLVGCQVPSSWECLLPAWSFLWVISVWDYYFHTGDKRFLRKAWKWVKQNLRGAEKFRDERGLFSGPFWNMFDWSGIDDAHSTVLHNSMFVVGAIEAALRCASELGDKKTVQWLRAYRKELIPAINALWDPKKQAYPDSVHEDGTISESISQHTSFLALLYDVVEARNRESALKNCLRPPKNMVRVGSPFAIMYLYEALEKYGHQDAVIESIYASYLPMLEDGATTVWESFPSGTTGQGGFPTRSHCHAWSSAPIHFLNRIVLGIVPVSAGGATFDISPRVKGHTWARGRTASVNGPVSVSWKREGKTLRVEASGPEGVRLRFKRNDTHAGITIVFNGRRL